MCSSCVCLSNLYVLYDVVYVVLSFIYIDFSCLLLPLSLLSLLLTTVTITIIADDDYYVTDYCVLTVITIFVSDDVLAHLLLC